MYGYSSHLSPKSCERNGKIYGNTTNREQQILSNVSEYYANLDNFQTLSDTKQRCNIIIKLVRAGKNNRFNLRIHRLLVVRL